MDWNTFLIEIALFCFLGMLYYIYQRRKILQFEANKNSIVMGMILQSCLSDKTEEEQPQLEAVISALDDFLHNRSTTPPVALLNHFMHSEACSPELREVIQAGLKEIESDGKE